MKVNDFDITGRVAIVTGGAGLLGQQHCQALLNSGASVYVADINTELIDQVCYKLGNKSYPLKMDVTDEDNIKNALNVVLSDQGRLDILINNAAIDPKVKLDNVLETSRLENFSINQWNHQLSVGLTGAFLCSKIFGGYMSTKGRGCILNISSDLSVFAPDQRLYNKPELSEDKQPVKPVTYSVIKTALIGLTRYLASYWAEKNIRVNAISPGGVYVDQPDEFVQKLVNLIPLGRMAQPDEYRCAIQFLCSDASKYMTGQNIVIDGGRSII